MLQAKYLGDEAKEKSAKNIDANSWDMEYLEDLPQQQNGYVLALSKPYVHMHLVLWFISLLTLLTFFVVANFIFLRYDCGMFMLKYIDFFSRGLGLCFSQVS